MTWPHILRGLLQNSTKAVFTTSLWFFCDRASVWVIFCIVLLVFVLFLVVSFYNPRKDFVQYSLLMPMPVNIS